jgi:purine-cytosine permease-like protein
MTTDSEIQEDVRQLADKITKIIADYARAFRVYNLVATALILGLLIVLIRLTADPVVLAVCYAVLVVAITAPLLARKGPTTRMEV